MDLKQVFITSAGRPRSGWRLLIFIVILVVLSLLFGAATKIASGLLLQFAPSGAMARYLENFIFRLEFLIVALLAGFICTRFLEGLPWRALGLWLHARWARDFLFGSVIGLVSLALATAIATAGGGLSFTISPRAMLVKALRH